MNSITPYSKLMMVDYGLTEEQYNQIFEYMTIHNDEHTDPRTGELNAGELAEACARDLDHYYWLVEEFHPVWDLTADFATIIEDRLEGVEIEDEDEDEED